ncbi:MAG: deoxyribose-phosphate aldolase [Chloroflexaceae bacterium]|nr:deoxyribose-phosphate aldolase [Chloroflexaceae bacterium]
MIEQVAATVLPVIGMADVPWVVSPYPAARQFCELLAGCIDHTLLKPEATAPQIEQLCQEAIEYRFAAVCVNPLYVEQAARLLEGSSVNVCTVVGFPLGATTTATKLYEAQQAIQQGATEIDMVIQVGRLKVCDYRAIFDDINQVATACCRDAAMCKVIIETVLLTDEEKIAASLITSRAQATYVKTSTGFAGGGATEHDVALLRYVVGPTVGVKASGGIRTRAAALAMVSAGATRIGASASVAIVKGEKANDEHSGE